MSDLQKQNSKAAQGAADNISPEDRAIVENLEMLMNLEVIESEEDWEAIEGSLEENEKANEAQHES